MMDLSFGKDEKAYYIVNVKLNEDGKNFTVFYADGHTEEHPFLVHNYSVYIYRMKHQFLDNREKYEDTLKFVASMAIVKEAKMLLYSITGLMLMTNVNIPNALKIIMIVLLVLYNLGYALGKAVELLLIKTKLIEFAKTAEFVQMMENFRIDVIDPITGKEEDWYLFNIGDVDINSDIGILKVISMGINDEFKKEEGKRISSLFKDNYEKQLIKVPKEGK